MTLGPIGGGSRNLSSQACYSEGKKDSKSQDKGGSWEAEACWERK